MKSRDIFSQDILTRLGLFTYNIPILRTLSLLRSRANSNHLHLSGTSLNTQLLNIKVSRAFFTIEIYDDITMFAVYHKGYYGLCTYKDYFRVRALFDFRQGCQGTRLILPPLRTRRWAWVTVYLVLSAWLESAGTQCGGAPPLFHISAFPSPTSARISELSPRCQSPSISLRLEANSFTESPVTSESEKIYLV